MKTRTRITIVGLAINMLLPTAAFAYEGSSYTQSTRSPEATSTDSSGRDESRDSSRTDSSGSDRQKADPAKLCTNITDVRKDLTDDSTQKSTKLQENFTERSQKLVQKRTELTQKQAINRTKADDERTRKFAALTAKAKTPEQKLAVENYKTAVLAAIAKHRSDIDAADKVYLDKLIASVTDRQNTLLSFNKLNEFTITLAMSQAKASCAAGIPVKTVRQNLKTALDGAQEKFKEFRKTANKVNPDANTLKAEHKAAIKSANAEFRSSLKAALTTLKSALKGASASPKPSTSASPSPSAVPAL